MGQPAGVRVADLPSGDPLVAALIAQKAAIDTNAATCPSCGRFAVETAHGFCRACWLEKVAISHRQTLLQLEAQRQLWAARQAERRAREALAADPLYASTVFAAGAGI